MEFFYLLTHNFVFFLLSVFGALLDLLEMRMDVQGGEANKQYHDVD